MITGNGYLTLRDGRRLDVGYRFGSDDDDLRAGYLLCDTSETDPAGLDDRLRLTCEDGTTVIIAIMLTSNQHFGVIGRVLPQPAEAA